MNKHRNRSNAVVKWRLTNVNGIVKKGFTFTAVVLFGGSPTIVRNGQEAALNTCVSCDPNL
jgi:hypothetical protein